MRAQKILLAISFTGLFFGSSVGFAADQTVRMLDQDNNAVEFVVVSLKKKGVDYNLEGNASAVMEQRDQAFQPFVLAVQAGTSVSFPNFDNFRHHVYSFSKAKRFEIKLYGGDEEKSETFDKPGTIALGCNIHDDMLAYIQVVDTPHFGVTNANGEVVLKGVEAGDYTASVWHPRQMRRDELASQDVTITGSGDVMALNINIQNPRAKRRVKY